MPRKIFSCLLIIASFFSIESGSLFAESSTSNETIASGIVERPPLNQLYKEIKTWQEKTPAAETKEAPSESTLFAPGVEVLAPLEVDAYRLKFNRDEIENLVTVLNKSYDPYAKFRISSYSRHDSSFWSGEFDGGKQDGVPEIAYVDFNRILAAIFENINNPRRDPLAIIEDEDAVDPENEAEEQEPVE